MAAFSVVVKALDSPANNVATGLASRVAPDSPGKSRRKPGNFGLETHVPRLDNRHSAAFHAQLGVQGRKHVAHGLAGNAKAGGNLQVVQPCPTKLVSSRSRGVRCGAGAGGATNSVMTWHSRSNAGSGASGMWLRERRISKRAPAMLAANSCPKTSGTTRSPSQCSTSVAPATPGPAGARPARRARERWLQPANHRSFGAGVR